MSVPPIEKGKCNVKGVMCYAWEEQFARQSGTKGDFCRKRSRRHVAATLPTGWRAGKEMKMTHHLLTACVPAS
jgi:hypothetical protein